jgi:hypothetical protein
MPESEKELAEYLLGREKEAAKEPSPAEQEKQKRLQLSVIIILLLAGIIVVAYLLLNYFEIVF